MDNPFNFNIAKLAIVSGKVNKNFPPTANRIAKIINPNKIDILKTLTIFFEEIFEKNLSKKYKVVKINSV